MSDPRRWHRHRRVRWELLSRDADLFAAGILFHVSREDDRHACARRQAVAIGLDAKVLQKRELDRDSLGVFNVWLAYSPADLLRALVDRGQDSPVSNVIRWDFATADAHEMLENVVVRLSTSACQSLPVTRNGGLVGMITMENVGEFLMIQGALAEARQRRGQRIEAG